MTSVSQTYLIVVTANPRVQSMVHNWGSSCHHPQSAPCSYYAHLTTKSHRRKGAEFIESKQHLKTGPDMVAHACNSNYSGAKAGGSLSKTSLGKSTRPYIKSRLKKAK
jgi:hypothetical protein